MGLGVAAEYTFQLTSVFITLNNLGVQCPGLFIIATGQMHGDGCNVSYFYEFW